MSIRQIFPHILPPNLCSTQFFFFYFQYTKPVEEEQPPVVQSNVPKTPITRPTNGTVPATILDKNKNNATTNIKALTNNSNATITSAEIRNAKIGDDEVVEVLRSIVSVGDPKRKYTKMEEIGRG